MRYRLDPLSPTGLSPVETKITRVLSSGSFAMKGDPGEGVTPELLSSIAELQELTNAPNLVTVDLNDWLDEFTSHIVSGQSYREPTADEIADFIEGFYALMRGDSTSTLITDLGFTILHGYEGTTKRAFTLVYNEYDTERCWGAFLIDSSTAAVPRHITGLVEAPHPVFDGRSEEMALQEWRDNPNTLLLISGSHRTDATGTNIRDVAHQTGSLFHHVAKEFGQFGLPQLQQHGYDDATDPSYDVIVSTGSSNQNQAIYRLADSIEMAGFRVARNWDGTATVLTGLTNVQGDQATTDGSAFAHVEVNATTRNSEALRTKYLAAVKAAKYFDTFAAMSPLGAQATSGQFTQSLSNTANSTGSSPYWSRSNHRHRPAQGLGSLWLPDDYGMLIWSADIALASQNIALSATGTAHVVRLKAIETDTITNIHIHVGSSGASLANCYVALYQNGTLLSQSADQSTSWQSAGFKTIALAAPQSIAAGTVEIAFWAASGTLPSFRATANTAAVNAGLSNANSRFATADTGLTTTAPSTLGSKTASASGYWVGVS